MNKGQAEKLGEGMQRKREINKWMTEMEKGQEERRMNKNRRLEGLKMMRLGVEGEEKRTKRKGR